MPSPELLATAVDCTLSPWDTVSGRGTQCLDVDSFSPLGKGGLEGITEA